MIRELKKDYKKEKDYKAQEENGPSLSSSCKQMSSSG
jgi:hypothetical protein